MLRGGPPKENNVLLTVADGLTAWPSHPEASSKRYSPLPFELRCTSSLIKMPCHTSNAYDGQNPIAVCAVLHRVHWTWSLHAPRGTQASRSVSETTRSDGQLGCMRGIPSWAAFVAAARVAVGLHARHSTNTPETGCSMSLCLHVASRCEHPAPQKTALNESPAALSSEAPSACAAFGQWIADCAAGPHTRRGDGRLQRSKAA
jgi:hypothetical protein